MNKEIEVRVSYPWPGIPDDVDKFIVDENLTSEDEIRENAYEWALDMIFDRGISWSWEKKDIK